MHCRVWDMRTQTIVKTMETGKEVTSIEIIEQGQHITTADGNEVTPCCQHPHRSVPRVNATAAIMASQLPCQCWRLDVGGRLADLGRPDLRSGMSGKAPCTCS